MSEFEEFTEDQLRLIRSELLPAETTDGEFNLFVEQCRRSQLDPFARQIMGTPGRAKDRNGNWHFKLTIVTTIDGFRLIADRTGKYDGQTEQEWCGPDGQWRTVWLEDDPPAAARCGVYRKGTQHPSYAVMTWKESPGPGSRSPVWRSMPAHMLSKCAEALALRKAFPNDLSGLYTTDEMPTERPSARDVVERSAYDENVSSPMGGQTGSDAETITNDQVAELVAVFDVLPEDARRAAKQVFVGAWGRPDMLAPSDYPEALTSARGLVESRLRPPGVTPDGERVSEPLEVEESGGPRRYLKAEVMAERPDDMTDDEFLEALLVKANAMLPDANKGAGFEGWRDMQKHPVLIGELLDQVRAGTLGDTHQEAFLDG